MRPLPPPRDSYEQTSVVDRGRPGPPVSRQASSRSSATTTSQASRTMPTATVNSASSVTTAKAPMTVDRQSLIEVEVFAGASAVPILESWGLPQPDTVTNEGINSWMNQVIRAYSSGNLVVLSDSSMSKYRNAQLLNAGTLDMMRASLQTYSADCAKLLAFNTKCKAELAKNQQEFGLHMRTCQECSERYNTEKEAL